MGLLLLLASCKPNPRKEGQKRNTQIGQEWAIPMDQLSEKDAYPGLVYIEGGIAKVGIIEGHYGMTGLDNRERMIAVKPYYLDETEVTNIAYLEYLHYLKEDGTDEEYELALPDTTVWRQDFAFNDPFVQYYLRHPAFREYPVVGVSWLQAQAYCTWRTEAVSGIIKDSAQKEGGTGSVFQDVEVDEEGNIGTVSYETEMGDRSNVHIPDYRLPTESEWEYAALGRTGVIYHQIKRARKYPWDGTQLRNPFGKEEAGLFFANFKRGRGDYAGVHGNRWNDVKTCNVYKYPPNDFGLYNMAGNVNEWVEDYYRMGEFEELEDVKEKLGLTEEDTTSEDSLKGVTEVEQEEEDTYYSNVFDYGNVDNNRVYKGGSWNDNPIWLSPSARRWWPEDSSMATLGFRCAMTIEIKEEEEKEEEEEVEEEAEEFVPGEGIEDQEDYETEEFTPAEGGEEPEEAPEEEIEEDTEINEGGF